MVGGTAGSSPHILAGHGEVSFLWWKAFLTPLMNRFHIALWCSWSLEGIDLFLGASEGASLWLPCTPLCCWLRCPHLLGNKSESKKSNLGMNQVKGNSKNCAHQERCNEGNCWKKGGMRKGQTRRIPSAHPAQTGEKRGNHKAQRATRTSIQRCINNLWAP